MLLRFGTENHRSIRTYQEILFTASAQKDEEGILIDIPEHQLRIVPVTAIYGANASGKSTLLEAIKFFIEAILESHKTGEPEGGTPYRPFKLDKVSPTEPSTYDADFVINDLRFHYGFKVDGKIIVEEWLYAFPSGKVRSVRQTWYHRTGGPKGAIRFGRELRGENKTIEKLVRPNSLYLSAAAQNAHPQLSPIYDFFSKKVTTSFMSLPMLEERLSEHFEGNLELRKKALEFLKSADTGIREFRFAKEPVNPKEKEIMRGVFEVIKKHIDISSTSISPGFFDERSKVSLDHIGADGNTYNLMFHRESSGTKALLAMLMPIFDACKDGGVVIVDELSNSLHPLLSCELIKVMSSRQSNPGHGQLVFSTHDTNLLSKNLLRRDQIWFTEKDLAGATHIYPLSDIKVKKTDNLERGYLEGRFGAIPFLGRVDEILVNV